MSPPPNGLPQRNGRAAAWPSALALATLLLLLPDACSESTGESTPTAGQGGSGETVFPGDPCASEGEVQICFPGSPTTRGIGVCRDGTSRCTDGRWADCEGYRVASDELCNDLDDDCDGAVDEQCVGTCPAAHTCRPALSEGSYLRLSTDGTCEASEEPMDLAECGGCACGGGGTVSCVATVDLYADPACGTVQQTFTATGETGQCVPAQVSAPGSGVFARARVEPVAGACSPSEAGVVPTTRPACQPAALDPCTDGVCVPDGVRCVLLPGTQPCEAPYALDHVVYPAETSTCECSCEQQGSCTLANAWVYPQGTVCDGNGQPLTLDDECRASGLDQVACCWMRARTATVTCTPVGSAAQPSNLCCLSEDG